MRERMGIENLKAQVQESQKQATGESVQRLTVPYTELAMAGSMPCSCTRPLGEQWRPNPWCWEFGQADSAKLRAHPCPLLVREIS